MFKRKKFSFKSISEKLFLKNNNETNKQEQNKSLNPKTKSPGHSPWKDLQSKTVTKNPTFHILN